jgi:hypothetical protein
MWVKRSTHLFGPLFPDQISSYTQLQQGEAMGSPQHHAPHPQRIARADSELDGRTHLVLAHCNHLSRS